MASAQQGNIQRLTVCQLDSYKADTWILSPPCQPYTRQGDFGQFVQVFHFTDWLLEQACLSSLKTRPHSCYNGSFITSFGKVRAVLMMTNLSVMIFDFLSLFLMYMVPQILLHPTTFCFPDMDADAGAFFSHQLTVSIATLGKNLFDFMLACKKTLSKSSSIQVL